MFRQPSNPFFGRGEQPNEVSEDCPAMLYGIIRKTLVKEYFYSKLGDLQPETFKLKRNFLDFFRTASLYKTSGRLLHFHVLCKTGNLDKIKAFTIKLLLFFSLALFRMGVKVTPLPVFPL